MLEKMLRSKFYIEKSNKVSVKHNTDFVLDNYVEAEVKRALLPLYVAQWLTLAPKYSIRYNFVTSNGHKFNAFVWLCATCILVTWLYYVIDYWTKSSGLLAITVFAYSVSVTTAFIMNSAITTPKSNKQAQLIILLQRMMKRFKFGKIDLRNVTIINWVYVISIVMFNMGHFACRLADRNGIFILKIFTQFVFLSFDCNVVICIRMINMLKKCIEAWVSQLERLRSDNEMDNFPLKSVVGDNHQVIDLLNIYCQVFKHPIFFTVIVSFFQVIANVQSTILVKAWSISSTIAQIVWIKNITLLTLLSLEAENIHLQMKNSLVFYLVLGTNRQRDDQFLDVWCVLCQRCEQAEEWRGSLLPLGAALPPRFFAELAAYTVVILQFHFL